MKLWHFCLFLGLCHCEDFLLTDFNRKRFVQIGQDFGINREFEISFETDKGVAILKAGQTACNKNVTIFLLNNDAEPFLETSFFDRSEVFKVKNKVYLQKMKVSSFDYSSLDGKLFFSTNEGIYEYCIAVGITCELLKSTDVTGLTAYPEKKQIHYTECIDDEGFLTIFDFDIKKEKEKFSLDFCPLGVGFDAKTKILFIYDRNGIYEKKLGDTSVEIRHFKKDSNIFSMAVGSKHVFFVDFVPESSSNDVYKLAKVPKVSEMDLPISYAIAPHVAIQQGNLIVLDVEGSRLLTPSRTYKVSKEIKIDIEKKNVKSFRSDSNTGRIFWIHDHNAGKVFSVNIKDDKNIKSQFTFSVPEGEHLEDIEVSHEQDSLFLAVGSQILLGKMNDLTTTKFLSVEGTVKNMRLLAEEKVLVASLCTDKKNSITEISFKNKDLDQQTVKTKTCIEKMDIDSGKQIFGASSKVLYCFGRELEALVKLCDADSVTSVVVHEAAVYFVASNNETSGKKLFKIKKKPSQVAEDLLTEQATPASIAFLQEMPSISYSSSTSSSLGTIHASLVAPLLVFMIVYLL